MDESRKYRAFFQIFRKVKKKWWHKKQLYTVEIAIIDFEDYTDKWKQPHLLGAKALERFDNNYTIDSFNAVVALHKVTERIQCGVCAYWYALGDGTESVCNKCRDDARIVWAPTGSEKGNSE